MVVPFRRIRHFIKAIQGYFTRKMPGKCTRCGKSVYAAEEKKMEGQLYHNLCWAMEFKERQEKDRSKKNAE